MGDEEWKALEHGKCSRHIITQPFITLRASLFVAEASGSQAFHSVKDPSYFPPMKATFSPSLSLKLHLLISNECISPFKINWKYPQLPNKWSLNFVLWLPPETDGQ